jgi:hypothetical protein
MTNERKEWPFEQRAATMLEYMVTKKLEQKSKEGG